MSAVAPISALQLSPESPWPGLRSFDEGAQAFFFGRPAEVDALFRLVRRERLTVFYGRSGLGKTSLLQAGLFPPLRAAALLPVLIRLEYAPKAPHPIEQIKRALGAALAAQGIDARPPAPDETLWEYFHCKDVDFWDAQNRLVTPVLVFDQFEERFTLARRDVAVDARAEETIIQLSEMIENRTPPAVRSRFEASPETVNAFDFRKQVCKVVLALREDFLPELEGLRERFPTMVSSRFRLQGMSSAQALEVILKPGAHLVSEAIARDIVNFVSGAQPGQVTEGVVEPVLLSVVLAELNDRRRKSGQAAITSDLLSGSREQILEGFYHGTLAGLPDTARLLVEEGLLTSTGRRDNLAWEDALAEFQVDEPTLQTLIDRHLVRREDLSGGTRLELVHDRIAEVVTASRNRRRLEAARESDRRQQEALRRKLLRVRLNAAIAAASALVLAGIIVFYWAGYVRPSISYAKTFEKVFGEPVPIGPLSDAAVRHRSWSMKFVRQGLFGHVVALEAVDSTGRPTPRNLISSFLSTSDGQSTREHECHWDFVYDADDRVVYEVARDRFGRMVWGYVYSPASSVRGPRARERTGTYVGPDGLPKPQGQSRAEFVVITYDAHGFEIEHRYIDRDKQPMRGRDRAFGHKYVRDRLGREIERVAVDEDRKPMDDESGNAILRLEYDRHDNAVVAAAYGANGKPTLFSRQRIWKRQYTYDQWGNLTSERCLNLDGQPAIAADSGTCEERYEYDDRGNLIVIRYFDIAGNKIEDWDGYAHCIRRAYDERNLLISELYLNREDKPFPSDHWFDEVRYTYDDRQVTQGWAFFTAGGLPANNGEGVHQLALKKDDFGQEVERRFLGADHARIVSKTRGVHLERKTYDPNGNVTEVAYFDVNDQPCVDTTTQYHRYVTRYDSFGHGQRHQYFDIAGPVNNSEGFQDKTCEYDSSGSLVKVQYFDARGNPVLGPEGAYEVHFDYDAAGNTIMEAYGDAAGKPVNDQNKDHTSHFHRVVSEYNSFRQIVRRQFFDPDGNPVPGHPEGVPEVRYAYDSSGERSEIRFFRGPDEPTVNRNDVWLVRYEFDGARKRTRKLTEVRSAKGPFDAELGVLQKTVITDAQDRTVEVACYDAGGALVKGPDGYARKQVVYAADGRATHTYFGAGDGRYDPEFNVATKMELYDTRGMLLEESFRGPDGALTAGSLGYARDELVHEADGRVRHTLFGADNHEQFNEALGFARIENRSLGNKSVTTSYFGVDGRLITGKMGYAVRRFECDPKGEILSDAYFDPQDKPTWSPEGYHRMEKSATNPARYYDIANQPMPPPDDATMLHLAYVAYVESIHAESHRAGFRPGDILWSVGGWRYATSLRQARGQVQGMAAVDKVVLEELKKVIADAGTDNLPATVLRGGSLVALTVPTASARKILSDAFDLRCLPVAVMDAWLNSIPRE